MAAHFIVNENHATLMFHGIGEVEIDYGTGSHLPTDLAKILYQVKLKLVLLGSNR